MKIGNFEALEVTAMYFTFSDTSNLSLFGQEKSRAKLYIQSMICYRESRRFHIINDETCGFRWTYVYYVEMKE